jgi:hypothetical protein
VIVPVYGPSGVTRKSTAARQDEPLGIGPDSTTVEAVAVYQCGAGSIRPALLVNERGRGPPVVGLYVKTCGAASPDQLKLLGSNAPPATAPGAIVPV